ncbi:MAG: phosphoglycolate phosphatase [Flavobacteriales bacterium]|jgi:phosphoglycolate phosphatase
MLFIFDWDGTISDSADKIVLCMQQAAVDLDLEPRTELEIKNIIGLGLPEAMLTLYPGLPAEILERYMTGYSAHYIKRDQVPSPFFDGAKAAMDQLKAQGYKLAVATGKSRRGLNRVLDRLDMSDYFHATRCADETASKPSPLMLHQILEELSVDVSQAVMVGDTEWDLEMANQANMRKIAVSYGAHETDRLHLSKPDLMMDHFKQILDWRF